MSRARNLADLLDANGDVASGALDNVPPSNDASALTTGTLPIARIADGDITAAKLSDTYLTGIADGSVTATKLASTLDLSGKTVTLPAGTGGKVLQVVSTTKTDPFVTTSSAYTDITGFSVSITPSSTSSKILVTAYITGVIQATSGSYGGVMRLVRDSNDGIAVGDAYGNSQTATGTLGGQDGWPYQNSTTLQFLDSPSTTSATTYKVQVKHAQSKSFRINYGIQRDGSSTYDVSTVSTITVMEIAG